MAARALALAGCVSLYSGEEALAGMAPAPGIIPRHVDGRRSEYGAGCESDRHHVA